MNSLVPYTVLLRNFEADMGKLSVYARNRILSLWSSGVKIQKIKDIVEEEGIEYA